MHERREAVDRVIAKYDGMDLVWGKCDCIRIAVSNMREQGRRATMAKAGSYSTPAGAARALRRMGHTTLPEALEAQGFERIPPASAWLGDIIGLEAEDGWVSLFVACSGGRGFGFVTDPATGREYAAVAALLATPLYAWRV